jgi:type IV pilus assembly protein PilP
MKAWRSLGRWLALCASLALLTACGASGEDEIRTWMQEQRNQIRPRVTKLAEPKIYKPQSYTQLDQVEPYSKDKLTQALKRDGGQSTSTQSALIAPELVRRKEALEAFPLDAMSMVGTLEKDQKPVALVKVDTLIYQVRVGSYLGPNYGRVTRISESEIALREIVQDAAGQWVARPAALQLQERSK